MNFAIIVYFPISFPIASYFPLSRETEWLFSTSAGRRQLCSSAGCSRLVVVHLNRAHTFDNLKAVQDELSSLVMDLAPPDLEANAQVRDYLHCRYYSGINVL